MEIHESHPEALTLPFSDFMPPSIDIPWLEESEIRHAPPSVSTWHSSAHWDIAEDFPAAVEFSTLPIVPFSEVSWSNIGYETKGQEETPYQGGELHVRTINPRLRPIQSNNTPDTHEDEELLQEPTWADRLNIGARDRQPPHHNGRNEKKRKLLQDVAL